MRVPASVRSAIALGRPGVAGLAGLGVLAAHAAAGRASAVSGVAVAFAAAMAAAGALVLNQVQERDADARMQRTKERPLPAGWLGPRAALVQAAGLAAAGLAGLAAFGGPVPALLGVLAILVYNGAYTPLKRLTRFATITGLAAGGLIPAIGWAAGGGAWHDPRLHALVAFFVLWQMPHTWLLGLSTPGDHDRGGLVPPMRGLSSRQSFRVVAAWTAATMTAAALLAALGLLRHPVAAVACFGAACWMARGVIRIAGSVTVGPEAARAAFRASNAFALVVLLSVAAGWYHR